jgi:hypothetical protein
VDDRRQNRRQLLSAAAGADPTGETAAVQAVQRILMAKGGGDQLVDEPREDGGPASSAHLAEQERIVRVDLGGQRDEVGVGQVLAGDQGQRQQRLRGECSASTGAANAGASSADSKLRPRPVAPR